MIPLRACLRRRSPAGPHAGCPVRPRPRNSGRRARRGSRRSGGGGADRARSGCVAGAGGPGVRGGGARHAGGGRRQVGGAPRPGATRGMPPQLPVAARDLTPVPDPPAPHTTSFNDFQERQVFCCGGHRTGPPGGPGSPRHPPPPGAAGTLVEPRPSQRRIPGRRVPHPPGTAHLRPCQPLRLSCEPRRPAAGGFWAASWPARSASKPAKHARHAKPQGRPQF